MSFACTKSGKICKSTVEGLIALLQQSSNVSQIPVFKALASVPDSGIA